MCFRQRDSLVTLRLQGCLRMTFFICHFFLTCDCFYLECNRGHNEGRLKFVMAYLIFLPSIIVLPISCKRWKMRFSTYISIAGRKNRMSVKINVSVSRSILNLDCGPWNFFEMVYFLRNVWISVIDWTFFTCCFLHIAFVAENSIF